MDDKKEIEEMEKACEVQPEVIETPERVAEIIHNYGEKDAAEKIFDIIDLQAEKLKQLERSRDEARNVIGANIHYRRKLQEQLQAKDEEMAVQTKLGNISQASANRLSDELEVAAEQLKAKDEEIASIQSERIEELRESAELRAKIKAKDEATVFVQHIQRHLKQHDFVVCKICGKTINEIWHAEKG